MRFSVEDVAQQKFERSLRGYDREQVREFLTVLAAHLSDYVAENKRLHRENEEFATQLADYRRRERSLQDALEMAQRAATDTKSRADREAEVIVAEAELKAEHRIVNAERDVAAAREALAALKEQRVRVITEMRSTLEMHLHLIDSQKQPDYLSEAEEDEDEDEEVPPDTQPTIV